MLPVVAVLPEVLAVMVPWALPGVPDAQGALAVMVTDRVLGALAVMAVWAELERQE